jgi:adenylosuccinate lyase
MCNVLSNGEFLTENMLNNIDKKENDWKSSYILNHLIYNGKTRSEAYNLVKNDPSIYDQYKHITKEYIFDSIKKGMDKYD